MQRSDDWLDQAQGDLLHARNDLGQGFYDWACFSAQQAGEKVVKAVFQRSGVEVWGHSVADLLAELRRTHEVPGAIYDAALEVDKAYILARYPDAHPSGSPRRRYTRSEAERAVNHAAAIIEFCQGLLSPS